MTTTKVNTDGFLQFDACFYNDQISKVIEYILPQVDKTLRSYVYFNVGFAVLGFVELILLISSFSFLVRSSFVALALATLFLTVFSFFMLRVYFLSKKPEQVQQLKGRFLKACRNFLGYREGIPEHHVALANACSKFANKLQRREEQIYPLPSWLEMLAPTAEAFSIWWHRDEIIAMRESLLLSGIDEHIKLVKCEPTNLEAHAMLANAYVMLSSLYVEARGEEGASLSGLYEKKFRMTAERAIEEFKILSEYAPDDPWVHSQLAYSYHDLQMPQEEIREYETILKLRPGDKETLFKLGILYFQQGENAQGLSIYEELKRANYKRAELLIDYYGAKSDSLL